MLEIWKDVAGYEGYYQVSNLGRVKSLPRGNKKERILKPQYRKQNINTYRYFVALSKNNIRNQQSVHRLVAFAFPEICGEYFPGAEVNHKDENPLNNKAENLEWVNHTDNINWGTRNDRARKALYNRNGREICQYTLSGILIKTWPSLAEITRTLGIRGGILLCCKNKPKYKTSYGHIWKYKTEVD